MRRIIGEHFTRTGRAKVGYRERIDAEEAAERFAQVWYLCGFCHEYHCGNPPPGGKDQAQA